MYKLEVSFLSNNTFSNFVDSNINIYLLFI